MIETGMICATVVAVTWLVARAYGRVREVVFQQGATNTWGIDEKRLFEILEDTLKPKGRE